MVKAKKLIQWERNIVPIIMSSVFLYIIFTTSYTIITGDKLYDIRGRVAAIAILVGFVLYIYLAIIFPRKYPKEFLKYKRHAQKNLYLRRGKIGLSIILIIVLLMLFFAIFSWYKFGLEPDLIEILIFSAATTIFLLFGLYFIHICEKE